MIAENGFEPEILCGVHVEERLPDAALADVEWLAQFFGRERGRSFDEFFVGPGAVLMETLED